ncbi:hypothetical protein Pla108_20460 [Botrimarina colliarenosi]|uniref:Uncharacterized protein n=1 Tax=Botrimarina colliarenosi TaxID=2528001 RepID=A0A5C6ACW2_9BACT|nr:hypothetical protein Pla108_20460 [Botrimarina colliarenosi]
MEGSSAIAVSDHMDVGAAFKKHFNDPRITSRCRQYERGYAVFAARIDGNATVQKVLENLDLPPASCFADSCHIVARIDPHSHD